MFFRDRVGLKTLKIAPSSFFQSSGPQMLPIWTLQSILVNYENPSSHAAVPYATSYQRAFQILGRCASPSLGLRCALLCALRSL